MDRSQKTQMEEEGERASFLMPCLFQKRKGFRERWREVVVVAAEGAERERWRERERRERDQVREKRPRGVSYRQVVMLGLVVVVEGGAWG